MSDKEDIQFPINQTLLEDALKIKQERALMRDRISKIEAKKNEVTPSVYQKVKQDYSTKLNEITAAFLEKKTDIDRELSTLYETRSKVAENLDQHKEILEELKFRFDLGEFDDKKFDELSKEEAEKVGKFEKILTAVGSNIEQYEAIFADEAGIAEGTEPSIKKKAPKPAKGKPITEESDYMIAAEEGDYFAPEAEESKTPHVLPETHSDITKKTALTGEARVIIIEGEHSGQEYKLKKETTIGRANTNTIVIKDAKVSRQHSVIKQAGNGFVVLDLNSSNGVYVNHERIKEHALGDGDQIQIGDHILQFKV
ncbi:MAG: FHA domain-containing protein [Deltaproteobacteria bacterium]|nr:FHA domain-containing protein [Deltaproteobacteria bacterium]